VLDNETETLSEVFSRSPLKQVARSLFS